MEGTKGGFNPIYEDFWDRFSPVYCSVTEPYHSKMGLQLALQTKADKGSRVLEVACGSGFASLIIAQTLKPATTYCILDISKEMVIAAKKRYETSTFLCNPKNSFTLIEEDPIKKIELKEIPSEGIKVQAYKGNSENLPFADKTFDSYIASASLYVVESPAKMLAESYRVLREGGIAGFGVFGKEKDSSYFSIITEALTKFAAKYSVTLPKTRSLFYLGDDEAVLIKMCKDVGFKKIHLWHEPAILPISTKQFLSEKMFLLKRALGALPAEGQKELIEWLESEIEKRFVQGDELITVDYIHLICHK